MDDRQPTFAELEAEVLRLRAQVGALEDQGRRRHEERHRAEAELQARMEQLRGIYHLSEATGRAEDVETIYAEALRCLRSTLRADRASVLLFDPDGVMRFKAHTGLSDRYREAAAGHSPWTQDTTDAQPILISDVAAEPSLAALAPVILGEGIRSLGFIPLFNHGRLLGKLMIYYDALHRFDEEQVQLAQTIAAHIAFAIDRKRREEALSRARERLRAVIAGSPIILFAVDADGIFTVAEGRGLTALGVAPGQLLGRSVFTVSPDFPEIARNIRRALRGESFTAVVDVVTVVFDIRYVPLRDEEDRVSGVIGVATDITERRRAEEDLALLAEAGTQLTASLSLPTTLLTAGKLLAPRLADWCALYVVDPVPEGQGGHLREVLVYHPDPAMSALCEELQRRVPVGLYPAHPALAALSAGQALLHPDLTEQALRDSCLDEEHFQLVRRLGVSSRIVVPMHGHGRILGAIVLSVSGPRRFDGRDLQRAQELVRRAAMAIENARLYAEAQEATRAREEFLSIASHELRAPINTLHLQLQLLSRTLSKGQLDTIAPDRLLSMLDSGDRQTRRMSELIERLFDVSRIAAGKLELRLEEVDLAALVRDVAARYTHEVQDAGCALHVRAAGPCVGRWDRMRVDQVVTNLVANAVKYGAGKPIEISVESDGRTARLTVADQGIGIAAEQKDRVFERFERAAGSSYGGLGLGLYIVRKILQAMRGEIRLESQLGKGSTFVVELPQGDLPA